MKLSAIMQRFPKTIGPHDTLVHAREEMLRGGFHHLPVINDQERLVGVLSEGDIGRYQSIMGESIWSNPSDSVAQAMTETIQTAGPDDSVTEAAARMGTKKIGCLPITKLGKLVGLVTRTDILAAEVQMDMTRTTRNHSLVRDVMTPDPQTVHPDDSILDAASRMAQYKIRHLPVIDGERHVVGMLSDRDVRASIGDPSLGLEEDKSIEAKLMKVRDAMSKPAIIVQSDEKCTEVAGSLANLRASTVPVIHNDNTIAGVISYVDLLRAYAAI
jgi:CBS domain-containing protein